ncbi:MAG: PilZ domain-containing protein [Hyphomicrobiales bacterium]|nr:PilZ domain-containing protein [Hyphomicrobiales bacterium]
MGRGAHGEAKLAHDGQDARRHARVAVSLPARCLFEDRREIACRVTDMSPGGAALEAPALGQPRERVVAYVDEIGRLEGRVVRRFSGGFAINFEASPARRDKLADRLTWIVNRALLGLPEDRRAERIAPVRPWSTLVLADGAAVRCRILDVSTSGAAVSAEIRPPIGEVVLLGRTRGRVVRQSGSGVAIEFDPRQGASRTLAETTARLYASGS